MIYYNRVYPACRSFVCGAKICAKEGTKEMKLRKTLISLFAAAAVAAAFSAAASAAKITVGDGGSYTDFTALMTAVKGGEQTLAAGDTIQLAGDVENISTVTILEGYELTLDLAGHKITTSVQSGADLNTKHHYAIDNYGKLTIIDSSADSSGLIQARGIANSANGVMIIEGGTFEAIDANGGAAVWNEADLTVNGGTFKSIHVGSSSDSGGVGCLNNSGKALITGGTFSGANKRTYAIISTGEIEITPAEGKTVEVRGAHGGLAVDSGTATVNGGSYSSDDYYGLYVSNDGVGIDPMTAAVTVNGGTFDGKSYSVWIGSDYNNPVNSTIEIYGGTFLKPMNAQDCTREGAIVVYGGTFTNYSGLDEYLADWKVFDENGNVVDLQPNMGEAVQFIDVETNEKAGYFFNAQTTADKTAAIARFSGDGKTLEKTLDISSIEGEGEIEFSILLLNAPETVTGTIIYK